MEVIRTKDTDYKKARTSKKNPFLVNGTVPIVKKKAIIRPSEFRRPVKYFFLQHEKNGN
ncbi:hypothetical protein BJV82DRAFT_635888 [Fennellomyces sp. T-0311]|nr:hypothetical protein BJV82DRAFT_635888 [Fennellomyces sp. T-0311]